jgi:hypothetical protein
MEDQAALDVHAQLNASRLPNPTMADLHAEGVGELQVQPHG